MRHTVLTLLFLTLSVSVSTMELNGDVLWIYSATAEASAAIQMAVQDLTKVELVNAL